MTDKELIEEARKLVARCRTYNFGLRGADRLAHDIAPQLADALEARSVAYTELLADYEAMKARTDGAVEWEYRYAEVYDNDMYKHGPEEHGNDASFDTAEEARAARIEDTDIVVRRPKRPTGPWIPVEGESKP